MLTLFLVLAVPAPAAGVPALERAAVELQAAAAGARRPAALHKALLVPRVARRIAAGARLEVRPPMDETMKTDDPSARWLVLPELTETSADGTHQYGAAVAGVLEPSGHFDPRRLQAWHRRSASLPGGRTEVELALWEATLEGVLVSETRRRAAFDSRTSSLSPDASRRREFQRLLPRILKAHGVPSLAELVRRTRGRRGDALRDEWKDGRESGAAESTVYYRERRRLGGLGGMERVPFLVKTSWTREKLAEAAAPGGRRSEEDLVVSEFEVQLNGELHAAAEDRTHAVVFQWRGASADPFRVAAFDAVLARLLPRAVP